jgi:AhpD family alkylhydroperoxidase
MENRMSRIRMVDPETAAGAAGELLAGVRARLGVIPNFTRVLAQSPKALEGFLGLYGASGGFALDEATRERIALAVAEGNGCEYCVSAHTEIGRRAGLTNEEMLLNRRGASGEPDRELVEIIALVALNAFTNLLGKAARVDIDFPKAVPL